jgi:putative methyltransferase (TIGR04325 family)
MSFRSGLIKKWLPPAILPLARRLYGKGMCFKGNYKTWEEAAAICSGYDDVSILEKVLDATIKVKSGQAVFERDSVVFGEIQYSWPVTAALMWVAAKNNGNLNVLDFGGALGSSYFQNKKFLADLKVVSWSVVEQAHFVEKGRAFVEDNVIKFHASIEESVNAVSPNVILLSSVAQYLPDIDWLLGQINRTEACTLIFDRTPFSGASENSICIQNVPSDIYKASYPMWLLSRERLLGQLSNWKVHESFGSAEGRVVSDAGIEFEFSGYIFERIHGQ